MASRTKPKESEVTQAAAPEEVTEVETEVVTPSEPTIEQTPEPTTEVTTEVADEVTDEEADPLDDVRMSLEHFLVHIAHPMRGAYYTVGVLTRAVGVYPRPLRDWKVAYHTHLGVNNGRD